VPTFHLQGGADPGGWQTLGVKVEVFRNYQERERFAAKHDVGILKTCTPYLAGNVPAKGEHLAWMESSAVIYANSVLGARTNTEGRESTSAAMLTGKIPDWGLHRTEHRFGTHRIDVDVPVDSVMDWGMLGYYVGDVVQERIPVVIGTFGRPEIVRLKHFGAAASSSGGVEMYHIVGVTPEADSLEMAFGPKTPVETYTYGKAEQRRVYDRLNANASDPNVDFVMLGCPHAALEQLTEAARLLDGKKVSANCSLWIFTSRAVKNQALDAGLLKPLSDAGAVLLTDTCSAFAQALPPGTRVAALDSAKQVHYLPAILGVQAWFGSTTDCINAALTGRWSGERP
jgi:predicted aconitase